MFVARHFKSLSLVVFYSRSKGYFLRKFKCLLKYIIHVIDKFDYWILLRVHSIKFTFCRILVLIPPSLCEGEEIWCEILVGQSKCFEKNKC